MRRRWRLAATLAALDKLAPAEQDAIVADLQARRPVDFEVAHVRPGGDVLRVLRVPARGAP